MTRLLLSGAMMLLATGMALAQPQASLTPFECEASLTPECTIDKLVFAKLEKLGIQPARLCSDAVFIRRVYFDLIGTLPTLTEAREFINDTTPGKRAALIDKLLEREEYADYWSMKWADILRVKAEFPINLWPNAVQSYHRWIRVSFRDNKPYDKFVREMLLSNGSNFRVGPVNFFRAMQDKSAKGIAQSVSLTFMGTRPEGWSKEQMDGLTGFFAKVGFKGTAEWKEEIVFFDPNKGLAPKPAPGAAPAPAASPAGAKKAAPASQPVAKFPDGTLAKIDPDQDPREVFANWLLAPGNPYFAPAIANRTWGWLQGRGIVHEVDDFRPDNPPVNFELLAYLAKELENNKYNLKHLQRIICNSKTYQLSSVPRSDKPDGEKYFANYALRKMDAEVLIDALCQITGTTEKYSSPIPEPFTFIPENQRSIVLADGSTTSSFLELFGRPSRDTGLDSERNPKPSAGQRLHLLNSSHIQRKLENSSKLASLMSRGDTRESINNLYLAILSRYPSDKELETLSAYTRKSGLTGRQLLIDYAWALINSAEFQYRH